MSRINPPRTCAFHSLGCKVNAYETEAMQQQLQEAGYKIVAFEEAADVYVINTCSVTNIADRKSRQMLHRAKKRNPDAVVVAAGCYVQTAATKTGLPVEADILLGNDRKGQLVKALEAWFRDREETRREDVIDIAGSGCFEELTSVRSFGHTRAFLKVQDGCNQFCSYCIIPYARGRIRSRNARNVLEEIERLTRSGIQEIVLTGIHLSSYGKDLQEEDGLLELIRSAADVPGVKRIRLGSLEPGIVTPAFAEGLKEIPAVCPHFHLSLQSGSDSVLRRMNRRYTTAEYAEKCALLRETFGNPALTTDVIAGFPGETEAEHEQTMAFLADLKLYETHIFKYSLREGTAAARMRPQVSEPVKTQRSEQLITLGRKNKALYEHSWDQKRAEVLFEEKAELDGEIFWTGYTKEYVRVYTPAADAEASLENRICSGRIEKFGAGERKALNFRIET